jgi:hypothetical protein
VIEQLLLPARFARNGGAADARLGLHLRARRASRPCSTAADALRRGAGVPGGGREHGLEQSARMVAMKPLPTTPATLIGELQLVYNKARQAAITKELSEIVGGAAARFTRFRFSGIEDSSWSQGKDRSVHRRGGRRGVSARPDARKIYDALKLDGVDADARSAAAARRRRRAHDRDGLLRRPAPRHAVTNTGADLGAGRQGHARPHHGRARPADRRSAARSTARTTCRSTAGAGVRRAVAVGRSCSKPASRSST